MNNTRNIIIVIAIALVLIAVAFFTGRCTAPQPEEGVDKKSDTVYIRKTDTIKVDTIIYRTKRILDTIYLPADTTLYVEQIEYEDSLSHIWVSGVEPAIDSIVHFIPRDTVIVTNETTITISEKKRWKQFVGFGVHLGLGAGYNPIERNAAIVMPEIGVGFVYGFGYTF